MRSTPASQLLVEVAVPGHSDGTHDPTPNEKARSTVAALATRVMTVAAQMSHGRGPPSRMEGGASVELAVIPLVVNSWRRIDPRARNPCIDAVIVMGSRKSSGMEDKRNER